MISASTKGALLGIVACLTLSGCDDHLEVTYADRAEAEEQHLFERGWLPEIIPQSSREISMTNNLDLNTSKGEFSFDSSEHDAFVSQLQRASAHDKKEAKAYSYEGSWIFWISPSKDHCQYQMELN